MRPSRALAWSFLLAAACLAPPRAFAQSMTIYRCVDAKGHLALRDTPCLVGEKQETRTMVRPVDAPPRPEQARVEEPVYEDHYVEREVTYVSPPRPLFECITPDGEAYTSDTGDGNPRWVPLWTLGYYPSGPFVSRGGGSAGVAVSGPNYSVGVGGGIGVDHINPVATLGSGTYVRDTCYQLPQADVCDRVRDRRDELRKRFFNAQPSERDVLRVEERSLNARLDADCGGR